MKTSTILISGAIVAVAGAIGYITYENNLNNGSSGTGGGSSNTGSEYLIPYNPGTTGTGTGSSAPTIVFPSNSTAVPSYPTATPSTPSVQAAPSSSLIGYSAYATPVKAGNQTVVGTYTSPSGNSTYVTGSAPANTSLNNALANINANAGAGIVSTGGYIVPESGVIGSYLNNPSPIVTTPTVITASPVKSSTSGSVAVTSTPHIYHNVQTANPVYNGATMSKV
jgi:hypothetical protein